MKRKRSSVEQIVTAVKQHEMGDSAADTARKLGIEEQTFHRWRKQYGGLEPAEVRELKQLREENAKLKRLVADRSCNAPGFLVCTVTVITRQFPCQGWSVKRPSWSLLWSLGVVPPGRGLSGCFPLHVEASVRPPGLC